MPTSTIKILQLMGKVKTSMDNENIDDDKGFESNTEHLDAPSMDEVLALCLKSNHKMKSIPQS